MSVGRIAAVLLIASVSAVLAGCGSGAPKDPTGNEVATIAEASSCDRTDFYVTDGKEKHTIYNCVLNGRPRCVVYVDGIARDETEEIVLSFANALGNDRPSCAGQNS